MTEKPLNMGILLKKRVSIICSTLRSRSLEYKHRLIQEVSVVGLYAYPATAQDVHVYIYTYMYISCAHMTLIGVHEMHG